MIPTEEMIMIQTQKQMTPATTMDLTYVPVAVTTDNAIRRDLIVFLYVRTEQLELQVNVPEMMKIEPLRVEMIMTQKVQQNQLQQNQLQQNQLQQNQLQQNQLQQNQLQQKGKTLR